MLSIEVLITLCSSAEPTQLEACQKTSEAIYRSSPVYFRYIDRVEEETSKHISTDAYRVLAVINALVKREGYLTLYKKEF
jgi:hypothetical protein